MQLTLASLACSQATHMCLRHAHSHTLLCEAHNLKPTSDAKLANAASAGLKNQCWGHAWLACALLSGMPEAAGSHSHVRQSKYSQHAKQTRAWQPMLKLAFSSS